VAGHHALWPVGETTRVITVLRDPVERAWSHYRALGPDAPPGADPLRDFRSLGAVLDDPVFRWIACDHQARWLATRPPPDWAARWGLPPDAPGDSLEPRALGTLRRCALAGTVDRLDEFVEALGRLVGRPLAVPPRLNVRPADGGPAAADAARVRALSRVDALLHAEAGALLDRALASLPPLPAEPEAALPYRYEMSEPLYGTGWHARMSTPEAGWHRWTGPGTRSVLRLPVRLAGPARMEMEVLSACDDEAVRSLRLFVQERPVEHSTRERVPGLAATARVRLDPGRPLTVAVEVAHTRHLVDAATAARSPDPAGVAVGGLSFTPIP
jgi:hypothetical protein